jgi:peptidyl-prolyl cis-trans isomerase C
MLLRRKNLFIHAGGGVLVLALILVCLLNDLWALELTKPVAKVNNETLTEADLEKALDKIMPAGGFHGGMSSHKRASFRPQAMEKMVEAELLFQEARTSGIVVDQDALQSDLDSHIKRFGSVERYKQALEQAGMSDNQFRKRLTKDRMINKLLELHVKNKAAATNQDAKTFYQANKKSFFRPETRRIRHILIASKSDASPQQKSERRARAEEVLAKLRAGEEMSVLAWKYSDDPYRVKGGDLGMVHKGRLEPAIERAAVELRLNQISDIIKTKHGYHIIRVEAIQPSKQLGFEEVADNIRKMLTKKKEARLKNELITRLKSEARIEYY